MFHASAKSPAAAIVRQYRPSDHKRPQINASSLHLRAAAPWTVPHRRQQRVKGVVGDVRDSVRDGWHDKVAAGGECKRDGGVCAATGVSCDDQHERLGPSCALLFVRGREFLCMFNTMEAVRVCRRKNT